MNKLQEHYKNHFGDTAEEDLKDSTMLFSTEHPHVMYWKKHNLTIVQARYLCDCTPEYLVEEDVEFGLKLDNAFVYNIHEYNKLKGDLR